jgi:hypothetical protein
MNFQLEALGAGTASMGPAMRCGICTPQGESEVGYFVTRFTNGGAACLAMRCPTLADALYVRGQWLGNRKTGHEGSLAGCSPRDEMQRITNDIEC